MLRMRARSTPRRRYLWMLKQVWYYAILLYLAFICFYLLNITFPTKNSHSKVVKIKYKKVSKLSTASEESNFIIEREEDLDDFMNMFPDPRMHPNPQELRHRKYQQKELQNSQLAKKRRLQIESEQRAQQISDEIRLWNRIQILEDILPYNFSITKVKHRVNVISKIRWHYMKQQSVAVEGFGDSVFPNPITTHYKKLRDILNTEQTIKITYKPFTLIGPSFVNDIDRNIFLKNRANQEAMRERSNEQFRGIIDVYRDGLISEKLICEYRNTRRMFIEFTTKDSNVKSINKVVCPLLVPNGSSFQQFIYVVLPKIIQAYDAIVSSNIFLLINEPHDENIIVLYDRLGIDRSRLIFHNRGLWKIQTVLDACISPPFHPSLFQVARRIFGSHDNLTIPYSKANVILLLRHNVESGERKMINNAEVTEMLFNRYGSNLKLISRTLIISETVEIFKNAKIIIGVHGGALYNQIFAPTGTSIIEILPMDKSGEPCQAAEKLKHQNFWHLSAMLGQNYWLLVEEPKQYTCNVKVDLKKLDTILDKIDNRHQMQEEEDF